ncbi:Flagellar biosynthesis protein FlhF [Polystyrenella longa]|uniref:Flagellar biosynthesis protein FlhF n=1 Tax=Polystyrenella longa TaxID=2528007 RepID=A0A518CGP4_9PLAN|nr:flagellar biosynthesis protein FlhF [Polystyrenella longa]QDU78387.1 Flagellar biosynthesis protein FlhF [Polystyrenella longa]
MQQIKTFRAASMQDALDLVRSEVGPEAVILHTKQIADKSYLPWKKAKQEVEITVSIEESPSKSRLSESIASRYQGDATSMEDTQDDELVTRRPAKRPVQNTKSMAMQLLDQIGKEEDELELSTPSRGPSQLNAKPARPEPTSAGRPSRESMLNRPLTSAKRQIGSTHEKLSTPASKSVASDSIAATQTVQKPQAPSVASQIAAAESKPVPQAPAKRTDRPQSIAARSLTNDSAGEPASVALPPTFSRFEPRPVSTESAPRSTNKSYVDEDFAGRLANIERMLLNMGRQNPMLAMHELPNSLFNLYTRLIDVDVAEDVARELVFDIKKQCRPQELQVEGQTDAVLDGLLEKQFQCGGPIQVTRGRRKVVALVGATGVGKTTTIAKLAANFKLRQGLKIGLVTVDTYRIAAVEQLRTYAEIMDLPVKVVTDAKEMRQALDELQGLDLVLIDTGGRSPKDEPKIQELKALLHEARADEVHLVLNLTASLRSLESMANEFATAGTTSMILTKLDETEGLGPMLNLARKVSLPVSYLTTGQAVPEDIEPATEVRMRRLLLGQETLGRKPAQQELLNT